MYSESGAERLSEWFSGRKMDKVIHGNIALNATAFRVLWPYQ